MQNCFKLDIIINLPNYILGERVRLVQQISNLTRFKAVVVILCTTDILEDLKEYMN